MKKFLFLNIILALVLNVGIQANAAMCQDGKKLMDGKCYRNIVKCIYWESENVCKRCEPGYHVEQYGSSAICYPDANTAKSVCRSKKPACKYSYGSGWAADESNGFPWVDCGDDPDNVWWFMYRNGSWIPNGKKGNPGC